MLIALSFSASNPAFADPTCAYPHANKKRHVRKDAIFRFLQDSGVAVGPSLDRAAAHLNAQRQYAAIQALCQLRRRKLNK
jgi:hypothetical protein